MPLPMIHFFFLLFLIKIFLKTFEEIKKEYKKTEKLILSAIVKGKVNEYLITL